MKYIIGEIIDLTYMPEDESPLLDISVFKDHMPIVPEILFINDTVYHLIYESEPYSIEK